MKAADGVVGATDRSKGAKRWQDGIEAVGERRNGVKIMKKMRKYLTDT